MLCKCVMQLLTRYSLSCQSDFNVTQNVAEFAVQCSVPAQCNNSTGKRLPRDQWTSQGQHEELLAQHSPLPDNAPRNQVL